LSAWKRNQRCWSPLLLLLIVLGLRTAISAALLLLLLLLSVQRYPTLVLPIMHCHHTCWQTDVDGYMAVI
jgi:hypothetical protein